MTSTSVADKAVALYIYQLHLIHNQVKVNNNNP